MAIGISVIIILQFVLKIIQVELLHNAQARTAKKSGRNYVWYTKAFITGPVPLVPLEDYANITWVDRMGTAFLKRATDSTLIFSSVLVLASFLTALAYEKAYQAGFRQIHGFGRFPIFTTFALTGLLLSLYFTNTSNDSGDYYGEFFCRPNPALGIDGVRTVQRIEGSFNVIGVAFAFLPMLALWSLLSS